MKTDIFYYMHRSWIFLPGVRVVGVSTVFKVSRKEGGSQTYFWLFYTCICKYSYLHFATEIWTPLTPAPPPPPDPRIRINSILMLIKMHYWSHRSANHLLDFLSWPYYLLRINTCAIVKKVRYIYYRVMKRYFCC